MTWIPFVRRAAPGIATLVVLVVAWQLGASAAGTLWFPPFSVVVAKILDLLHSGQIVSALASSLENLLIGYVLAVVVGVAVGTAMGLSRLVDLALRTYVDAMLFVPPVVLAPVFFLFFGFSDFTLVAVVFIFAVFVIILNTATAIQTADPHLLEMATAFGASRSERLRDVTFPSALPIIFAGLQLGMGRAVKGMIVGEIIISVVGLGSLDRQFSNGFDAPGVWAIALLVVGIALVLTSVVRTVDGVVNAWAE